MVTLVFQVRIAITQMVGNAAFFHMESFDRQTPASAGGGTLRLGDLWVETWRWNGGVGWGG